MDAARQLCLRHYAAFVLLCAVCMLSPAHSQQPHGEWHGSFAYINDNYSATWLKGKSGNYIGADDFLTASFLARAGRGTWQGTVLYSAFTARRFNYRFDLVSLSLSKRVDVKGWQIYPAAGLLYKGRLGGKKIQNGWHQWRAIPRVHIPYSSQSGWALLVATRLQKSFADIWLRDAAVNTVLQLRFYTDWLPARISPWLHYEVPLDSRFFVEVLAGWRFYLSTSGEYGKLLRSGYLAAFNLRWRAWRKLDIDLGISFSAARNMQEAQRFGGARHNDLPQLWLAFGWSLPGSSLNDFVGY